MKQLLKSLRQVEGVLTRAESALVAAGLLTIVFVALFQIAGRNLFSFAVPGLDVLMRALVLWITFFGASIATTRKRHIAIDALNKFLPAKYSNLLSVGVGSLAIVICWLLALAAYDFVASEKLAKAHFVWGIPAWWVQLILPTGFLVISFKFLVVMIEDVTVVMGITKRRAQ